MKCDSIQRLNIVKKNVCSFFYVRCPWTVVKDLCFTPSPPSSSHVFFQTVLTLFVHFQSYCSCCDKSLYTVMLPPRTRVKFDPFVLIRSQKMGCNPPVDEHISRVLTFCCLLLR